MGTYNSMGNQVRRLGTERVGRALRGPADRTVKWWVTPPTQGMVRPTVQSPLPWVATTSIR